MQNRKFKRAALLNRTKAILFTVVFHLAAIGLFMNDRAYAKVAQLLPDTVTEWLGWEKEPAQEASEEKDLLKP